MRVPRQIILHDVKVTEFRWSGAVSGDGKPIAHVAGVYLDPDGNERGTWTKDIEMPNGFTNMVNAFVNRVKQDEGI